MKELVVDLKSWLFLKSWQKHGLAMKKALKNKTQTTTTTKPSEIEIGF